MDLNCSLYIVIMFMRLILYSNAMQYQEPLNIEDLDNLFDEDGCVEGTLSATETGNHYIKSVSFVESYSSLSKSNENNTTNLFEDKSPMSALSELAVFNNIKHQYTLTREEGPAHKKQFGVSLELGNEEYYAEGSSIKRAQQEAAKLALNSTAYGHPVEKEKAYKHPKSSSPEQKLNDWARKHGDAFVTYFFTEHSKLGNSGNHNYYHKGMYSKAVNVHKVIVKIGNQKFSGEGPTLEAAKQNAANNALKQLQNADGFCMFDDGLQNLYSKIFNSNSDNYSPISLVHEFGSKTKLQASFDLISEEGPAHIKRFVFKCTVGDSFETLGEGSSKKDAKREAAENMIQKLKSHASYNTIDCGGSLMKKRKSKRKKSKNLIKAVQYSYPESEISESTIPDDLNPISKLIQVQQGRHDVLPVFEFIEEKGKSDKQFFMKVTVGSLSFVGTGPSKKAAKKKAAEGMLEKLGYATVSGKTRLTSTEEKKKEFVEDHLQVKKKPIAPGLNIDSEKFLKLDNKKASSPNHVKDQKNFEEKVPNNKDQVKDTSSAQKNIKKSHNLGHKESDNQKKPSSIRPRTKLTNLAEELGYRFQFSDFPKGNNSGFVTLVSLTTDPPKVCYGIGLTTDISQDNASLTALRALLKIQLESVSQMLREPADPLRKEKFYAVDEKTVLQPVVVKETE